MIQRSNREGAKTLASLVEELIAVLTEEATLYDQIVPIAEEKTKVIVANDLQMLQNITEKEKDLVDQVTVLEHKRQEVIHNIGTVLNRKDVQLKVKDIIQFLEKQPKEQQELRILHDRLKRSIQRLMEINNRNKSLIIQSLEMIEFNMNFIQSTRMSPGNSNYTRGAVNNDPISNGTRMFDAKQ